MRKISKDLLIDYKRRSLQDNLIDKIEYECVCKNFTKYLYETKLNLFLKRTYKIKVFQ